jgi:hypothetical protein
MEPCSQITDIQLIKADVKEIKDALLGTDFNEKNGYIKRLSDLEIEVKKIKGKTIFFAGIGSGVSFVFGFISSKIFGI